MKIKTYDFGQHEKFYVADGKKGFTTADRDSLLKGDSETLVVEKDGCVRIAWKVHGILASTFYTSDEFGNIQKVEPNKETNVFCAVKNAESKTLRTFNIVQEEGIFLSEYPMNFIMDEDGSLRSERIVVNPGTYEKDKGGAFVIKECRIYNDEAHASWYAAPTIDGVKKERRADSVKPSDAVVNSLTTKFIELKALADANSIVLIANEYTGEIHAVHRPEGFKVESDDRDYANMIPWELMPVIGKCAFTMNEDSDFQPHLKEVKKE